MKKRMWSFVMNVNSPRSEREKIKAQIQKLLALSKSPFKAEAEVALKKAKELMKIYNAGKVKILHPDWKDYELMIYRAFIEKHGCVWNEKYVYGTDKIIKMCQERSEKCFSEILIGIRDCEKILEQSKKNIVGVPLWYIKGFYQGLCEGLDVRAYFMNLMSISHLDYGSQIYVYNNARTHGFGIGRYYRENNCC